MIYKEKELEMEGVLQTARQMCTAARTAPKARGLDFIHTAVVTGEDLKNLADETERLGKEQGQDFYVRDADNLRKSQAVVLIGVTYQQRGLNECCGWCNQTNCQGCRENQSVCVFDPVDIGNRIGIGSQCGILKPRGQSDHVFCWKRSTILGDAGTGSEDNPWNSVGCCGKSAIF